jgi:lysophospholipase L1-like esterase
MLKKDSFGAKFICILLSILILLSFEIASRLFFPETLLGKITFVLKQDPILFWRQKSNIRTKFQGKEINTDWMGLRNKNLPRHKKKGTTRIICLGASPTFGWGVNYEDTYPCQLEKLLNQNASIDFEVINGGEIGYSSYQGLLFLKNEISRLNPDIITVSYVLNDIDKYRFFRSSALSDQQLKPLNSRLITIINFIHQSNLVRVIERLVFGLKHIESKSFDNSENIYLPGINRVSFSDYQNNLQEIIDFSHKRNIKVLLVKIPVNLPSADQLPESRIKKSKAIFDQGMINLENQKYDIAIKYLLSSLKFNPYLGDAYYYLGICYEKKRESNMAKYYFRKARSNEAFRCGLEGKLYNNIMKTVADKNNVPLVNIVSAFSKNDREYLFIDPKYDPIHPNATGHKIIALEIYNTLIRDSLIKSDNQ